MNKYYLFTFFCSLMSYSWFSSNVWCFFIFLNLSFWDSIYIYILQPACTDHAAGGLSVWYSNGWYSEGACSLCFLDALPIRALLGLSHTSTHITAQKFPSPREESTCTNLILPKITLVVGLSTPFSFFYLLLLTWRSLRNIFAFHTYPFFVFSDQ